MYEQYLTLDNPEELICYKTQPNQTKPNQTIIYIMIILYF